MGRYFNSELGFALLGALADGILYFEDAVRRPGMLLRYGYTDLHSLEAENTRRKVANQLYRLKKFGYIQEIRRDRERAFRLTALGDEMLQNRLKSQPPRLQKGLLTIITFDIPQRHKNVRERFRNHLRSHGFKKCHWSVYISEYDWTTYFTYLLKKWEIEPWVIVIQGKMLTPPKCSNTESP